MKIRPLILAAAVPSALFAAQALAAPSIEVEYSDLDLATEHGQQVLERRLDSAAREACGLHDIKTGTILHSTAEQKCYRATRKELDQRFALLVEQASQGG